MTRRCAKMSIRPITFDHAEVGISLTLQLILSEVKTHVAEMTSRPITAEVGISSILRLILSEVKFAHAKVGVSSIGTTRRIHTFVSELLYELRAFMLWS